MPYKSLAHLLQRVSDNLPGARPQDNIYQAAFNSA